MRYFTSWKTKGCFRTDPTSGSAFPDRSSSSLSAGVAGTNAILAESVSWGRNLALPLLCYQLQVTAEAFLCLLAIGPPMPATQAGPVDRELTFRDVFTALLRSPRLCCRG